jgi:hypothetical protein
MFGPNRALPSRVWLFIPMKRTLKDETHPPYTMAKKKKGGLGRLFGAITGGPFERLQKQIDKTIQETESEKKLSRSLDQLVKIIGQQYEESNIDDEEHDILIEEIEDADPTGRSWAKVSDDEDMFYGDDMPDSPVLKSGKNVNLDDLMAAKSGSFTGSFGRDEFDEFKAKMANDFFADDEDSDDDRDDNRQLRMQNRAFGDEEDDLKKMKQALSAESGIDDPNAEEEEEEDENHYFDEDGIEWWKDEEGWWWYRESEEHEWVQYDE